MKHLEDPRERIDGLPVVRLEPQYPGGPTLYFVDDPDGNDVECFPISCSDRHNDRIMEALIKYGKGKNDG